MKKKIVALVVLPKVQLTLTKFPVSGVVAVLVVKKATLTSSVAGPPLPVNLLFSHPEETLC